jgi:hypothetical protein
VGRAIDAFAEADAALEKAQSLCERGAHQFLRDGDCETETAAAKKCFEEVISVCESEIEKLKLIEEEERLKGENDAQGLGVIGGNPADITQNGGIIEPGDDSDDEDDFDPSMFLPKYRLRART